MSWARLESIFISPVYTAASGLTFQRESSHRGLSLRWAGVQGAPRLATIYDNTA